MAELRQKMIPTNYELIIYSLQDNLHPEVGLAPPFFPTIPEWYF
jgi:hypothetical protein